MSYYQARISYETAQLLEELRIQYEKQIGNSVSKGECIDRAFQESLKVSDWKTINDTKITFSHHKISDTAKLLKVHISEETRLGIQDLKKKLPSLLGLRSVTIGVCIREILKSAFLANTPNKIDISLELKDFIRQSQNELQTIPQENVREKAIEILDILSKKINF
ncbi:TPA: hypothetical protein ACGO2N_000798 [Streptococcus suis]